MLLINLIFDQLLNHPVLTGTCKSSLYLPPFLLPDWSVHRYMWRLGVWQMIRLPRYLYPLLPVLFCAYSDSIEVASTTLRKPKFWIHPNLVAFCFCPGIPQFCWLNISNLDGNGRWNLHKALTGHNASPILVDGPPHWLERGLDHS